MKLLLFETAYDRIRDRIAENEPRLTVCLMTKEGDLVVGGQKQDPATFHPEIAWLSMDLMYHGRISEFIDVVSNAPGLKWVQTANAGLDAPIYQKIAATGTRLSNSDAQALSIAEYVLGHVLHCFQGIEQRLDAQRKTKWRYMPFREVAGSTWLIIGFGNIGQRIAERAKPFGAHIVGVRHSGQDHPLADKIIRQDDIAAALPEADVVILACPITDETRNMADADFFGAMQEKSLLVNIARGDLVDDDALIAALDKGTLGNAVLDAFSTEPLPKDHPFWTHDKVILTAHTSNAGSGLLARGDVLFSDNLKNYLSGQPLKNEVDMVAQFPDVERD